ncbi:S8 family serine peptidase [Streptomyces sp. NBC_00083]|uniref:S8 family serine peptidase n=1 Tax=Streptomyces sp. NBC_00083 TaxID=2975647 RepID=UPI00224EB910|nr:S8 family serine peptidase [Streptomyces sp. NBC_00083]MCX5386043.1 S8 family serine peptidase [Streptomyces sp. NBC_00083]
MRSGIRRAGRDDATARAIGPRRVVAVIGAWAVVAGALAPHAFADDVAPKQWYLAAMHASDMWKVSTGKGIKVAVVDSGVNPDTASLKGQVLTGEAPKAASYGATKDYDGHGTTMAELIAGTGKAGGLKGLAPDAKIIPFRIAYDSWKDEAEKKLTQSAAAAIRAAADSDAKIINLSFGGAGSRSEDADAVKYALSKGKLLFAATGNDGATNDFYRDFPAAYPGVVGVSAADESGTVTHFSQAGDYIDLASPGQNVPAWCDTTFTSYCDGRGTSQASAIASASAALIWSAHPSWTADQVLRTMIDTAGRSWDKDKPSKYLGYGLIRPRLVLEKPGIDPGPAGVDPVSLEHGGSAATPAVPSSPASPARGPVAGGKEQGGGNTPWAIGGVAAGLVAIGAGVFAAIRTRRRSAHPHA